MAFKIEYSVAAKPDVVLATIRREAPYWRESTIPRELRTAGTFGVAARVGQSSFHLHREDWNDPPYRNADLRGRIEPAASGSLIVVRVGLGRTWIVAPLIFGVLAFWTMMSNRGGGLALVAITAVFALWDFLGDRSISPEDPAAQHLVGRLELALSRIGENAIPASTPRAI